MCYYKNEIQQGQGIETLTKGINNTHSLNCVQNQQSFAMKKFAAFFQNLLSNCMPAKNASAINFATIYHSFIQLTDLKQIVQSFIIRSTIKGNFAITGKKTVPA